jgi:hypothetical protein
MKVASMKHSDKSNSPRTRRSSAKASSTLRSVPSRAHCWKRPAAPVFAARRLRYQQLDQCPLLIG